MKALVLFFTFLVLTIAKPETGFAAFPIRNNAPLIASDTTKRIAQQPAPIYTKKTNEFGMIAILFAAIAVIAFFVPLLMSATVSLLAVTVAASGLGLVLSIIGMSQKNKGASVPAFFVNLLILLAVALAASAKSSKQ